MSTRRRRFGEPLNLTDKERDNCDAGIEKLEREILECEARRPLSVLEEAELDQKKAFRRGLIDALLCDSRTTQIER